MTEAIKFVTFDEVEKIIDNSIKGTNTRFLSSAHSLWYRFGNYDKTPPMSYEINGEVVSLIFATYNRDTYSNLYEIVTIQGKEANGYATRIWDIWINYAVQERQITRLKMSCTPSSITWHQRNGLLWWAVDPSGSLRSDQPLFSTRSEQIAYREFAISNPIAALPPAKVRRKLLAEGLENYAWGSKKRSKTEEAIKAAGQSWLRETMIKADCPT
jgi:hypothetical protein